MNTNKQAQASEVLAALNQTLAGAGDTLAAQSSSAAAALAAYKPGAARVRHGNDLMPFLARMLHGNRMIPDDAAFFLVAHDYTREAESKLDRDATARAISDAMDAIRERYGVESEAWYEVDTRELAPPEWTRLNANFEKRAVEIKIEVLKNAGETLMAELLHSDPEGFSERYEVGRNWFFDPTGNSAKP